MITVHKQMFFQGLLTRWEGVVVVRRPDGSHAVVDRTKPMPTRGRAWKEAKRLEKRGVK